MAKTRVVLDCNVYVQAYLSAKGNAERILQLAELNLIEVFTSRSVLEELKDVLARPEFISRFPHFSPESIAAFLKRLNAFSSYVRSVAERFEFRRDPKDARYIDLAIDVGADYVVTWDRDLLDLMTGIDNESKEFRQRYRPLQIVDPAGLIEIVSGDELSLLP